MFWIRTDQLDPEQRQAVENIPVASSFLLTGPAGSGKTNILLLRAKYLTLKLQSNFKIIVFTKSLRTFVQAGCKHYDIDPASAVTQMGFFRGILQEYGVPVDDSEESFEASRALFAGKVMSLIDAGRISDAYCETLLVDEAQDYTDTELLVFRRLCKRLVLAADSRQSIYKATHTPGLPEKLVGAVVALRYHYRSGLSLCKVADAILSDAATYPRLQGECHYPEGERPSNVIPVPCDTFEGQIAKIVENLREHLQLYPGERIGVLFPKNEQVEAFSNFLLRSGLDDPNSLIWIDTLHGAKGWEFRAVHLGGCEVLYRMGAVQKRLIYTGVLRGKTSAHLYYSGHLPGYLEAALGVLKPPQADPAFDELFKKR